MKPTNETSVGDFAGSNFTATVASSSVEHMLIVKNLPKMFLQNSSTPNNCITAGVSKFLTN